MPQHAPSCAVASAAHKKRGARACVVFKERAALSTAAGMTAAMLWRVTIFYVKPVTVPRQVQQEAGADGSHGCVQLQPYLAARVERQAALLNSALQVTLQATRRRSPHMKESTPTRHWHTHKASANQKGIGTHTRHRHTNKASIYQQGMCTHTMHQHTNTASIHQQCISTPTRHQHTNCA